VELVKREGIYNYCVDADPAYPSFNTRQNVVESITVWKTCEREGIKKDRSSDETVTPQRKGKIKTKRRLLMFSFFSSGQHFVSSESHRVIVSGLVQKGVRRLKFLIIQKTNLLVVVSLHYTSLARDFHASHRINILK
jgi:hypothetical protein